MVQDARRRAELKNAVAFLVLAAVVGAAFYWFNIGGVAGAGIAAASILAVGISRGLKIRGR